MPGCSSKGAEAEIAAPEEVQAVDDAVEVAVSGEDVPEIALDTAVPDASDGQSAETVGIDVEEPVDVAEPLAPLSILFIGNSYTFVNDLPKQTRVLLNEQTPPTPTTVSSVTVAGALLSVHVESTVVADALAAEGLGVVVLQAQSLEPIAWPEPFQESAALLAAKVHEAGGELWYYATWARKAGDPVYFEAWSGGSPEAMAAGLEAAYVQAAQATGGSVAPVGRAFILATEKAPGIELYAADGSHPSVAGTYLAACVFAASLRAEPITAEAVPKGLSEADAELLRAVAVEAVAAFREKVP